MTCHDIQAMTVPYLELDLEPSRIRDVTAHLEGCEGCRAEMEAIRQVLVRVKGRTVPDPGDRFWNDFPDRIRLAVAQEQALEQGEAVPLRPPSATGTRTFARWPMALAASVLLVVVAWSFTSLFEQGPSPAVEPELPQLAEAEWQQFWDEDPDLALADMATGLDHQAVDRLFEDI